MLWIGFKILYLCGLKQSNNLILRVLGCCELVSKFCIFVVWNSSSCSMNTSILLWIGFKILYLCGLKQLHFWKNMFQLGCELVSKFCIFVVWNSTNVFTCSSLVLWIGFKILYLCGLKQYDISIVLKIRNLQTVLEIKNPD